jgi:hypothetical protein
MKVIFKIVFCLLPFNIFAANLLVNPDAETATPITSGWTLVSAGTNCNTGSGWRIQGNQGGYPTAESGSYIFFAGCSSSGEIYQDVNVSLNAINIDAGLQTFTFSGYTQSYNQASPDGAQIIVEYRNAANTVVLTSYNTTVTHNTAGWVNYANTTTAPAGTRFVRVRLLASLNSGPSNDGYFDNLSLTTNIPLPIQLNSFNAQPKDKAVEISWSTAAEKNNNFFTIERSADAVNWEAIKKTNGATNSNTAVNYTEWDYTPLVGKAYYRLRQTDVDGTSTLSTVLTVNNINMLEQITISPQPAYDKLEINMGTIQDTEVELFNSYGQTIRVIQSTQSTTTQLDVSNLETGMYFISIANGSAKETRRILINR